jgi:hypothetical protein
MILSEEQEKKIEELAVVTGIAIEDIKKAIVNFANAAKTLWEELKELAKTIHEIFNDHLILDDKPKWNTPKKIVMKSQVINRKPLMTRARNCC